MGTPEQERERLLKQVKEDNTEIASAERQYGNVYFYLLTVHWCKIHICQR